LYWFSVNWAKSVCNRSRFLSACGQPLRRQHQPLKVFAVDFDFWRRHQEYGLISAGNKDRIYMDDFDG